MSRMRSGTVRYLVFAVAALFLAWLFAPVSSKAYRIEFDETMLTRKEEYLARLEETRPDDDLTSDTCPGATD